MKRAYRRHPGLVRPEMGCSYKAAYERERRVDWYRQGLNSRGEPYKRHPNFLSGAERNIKQFREAAAPRRLARRRETSLANWRARAKQFKAMGLTSRGTVPKYAPRRGGFKLLEAYKEFRSQVQRVVSFEDIGADRDAAAYKRI